MENGKNIRPALTDEQRRANVLAHVERVRFFREQDRRHRDMRFRCLQIIAESNKKEN